MTDIVERLRTKAAGFKCIEAEAANEIERLRAHIDCLRARQSDATITWSQDVVAADLVVEGVEPMAGFCLRFRVQRLLPEVMT